MQHIQAITRLLLSVVIENTAEIEDERQR